MESHHKNTQFLNFLQEELAISAAAISVAKKHSEAYCGPLPMILWQYGMISIKQLQQIFDWLESYNTNNSTLCYERTIS